MLISDRLSVSANIGKVISVVLAKSHISASLGNKYVYKSM